MNRAVVFCNFPENLGGQLREHLEEWGIDVLHWGPISMSTEMKNPGAEMVIVFYELMSHGQSDKTKDLAKRWGARWVALSRKYASWGKNLPVPRPRPQLVAVGQSHAMPVAPADNDASGFLPEPPSEPSPESLQDPDLVEKQWEEIRDMFAGEVEDLKAKITELEAKNHVLTLQAGAAGRTEAELYELASTEEKRLKGVVAQLEGEVEKRDREIAQLKAGGLEALGNAIRSAVAVGLMEEREAADRLLNLVLGRRR